MSHHVDTMAYYGSVPWHKLGTQVDKVMTAAEALVAAGLSWAVKKVPALYTGTTQNSHGSGIFTVPNKFVTVREDNEQALGVVGSDYTVLQNKEAFSFFDAIVGEKLAIYHTCGSLKGGQLVWLLAKLPQSIKVLGVDQVDGYVLLRNSHDGSSAVSVLNTPVRVVCWNTLSAALSGADKAFHIRHTASMGQKVKAAREALGIVSQSLLEFGQQAELLARTKLNTQMVDQFLQGLGMGKKEGESSRAENKRDAVLQLIDTGYGNRQDAIKGSLWTAYNAVTQLVDHNDGERSDDTKLGSLWFGAGAQLKAKALEVATTLAK